LVTRSGSHGAGQCVGRPNAAGRLDALNSNVLA
jgi:hypothetical protein